MNVVEIKVGVKGLSPIMFSRPIEAEKPKQEDHSEWEKRIWRTRCHTNREGQVIVTQSIIKQSLVAAGKYTGEKIAGKGNKTYTGKIMAGTMIIEPAVLLSPKGKAWTPDEAECEREFGSSKGQRGMGPKVWKMFPRFNEWTATFVLHVLDPLLRSDPMRLREFLKVSGLFDGWGKNRPGQGSNNGRFEVTEFKVLSGWTPTETNRKANKREAVAV